MICHSAPLVVLNELQGVHTLLQVTVRKIELVQGVLDEAPAGAVRRDQDTFLSDGWLVLVDPVTWFKSVLLRAAFFPIVTEKVAYATLVVLLVVDTVLSLILDEVA